MELTEQTKTMIKKAAEKILYVIIGAALSLGVINSDKILDLLASKEPAQAQVETAVESYNAE